MGKTSKSIQTDMSIWGNIAVISEKSNDKIRMNMDNKELELAYDLLTAEEEIRLTKAVQDKGTDCDEMKKLREVYGNFVASVAKGIRTMAFRSTNSWRLERLGLQRLPWSTTILVASGLSPTPSGGFASLCCRL